MVNDGFEWVVEQVLLRLLGKDGYEVVKRIKEGEFTDEQIAEMTHTDLNIVRRTLFILYENKLAVYRREKDEESGWLTYYWRLSFENFPKYLERERRKLLRKLERRLKYEREKVFYVCEECGIRIPFEEAMDINFLCPNCGGMMVHWDNQQIIDVIEKKISELRK
ncbi:transcription factor E [Methanosarcinales archaeon]|nr:MAG: transcription factor E [Methanosarcinales archaeon]